MGIINMAAFIGSVASLGAAGYTLIGHLKLNRMQKANRSLEAYIKDKDFLLMKNGGENPCDTIKKFSMPAFSQEGEYLKRRKVL